MAIGHEATGATAPPVRGGPDTIRPGHKACRRIDSGGRGRSPDTRSARRSIGQTETGDDAEPGAHREGGPCGRCGRSEEHTSELQSLMRISYAVYSWTKKNKIDNKPNGDNTQ